MLVHQQEDGEAPYTAASRRYRVALRSRLLERRVLVSRALQVDKIPYWMDWWGHALGTRSTGFRRS